jgi:hypothetical protein
MARGLILVIGESFRTGGQASRIRGQPSSRPDQLTALSSHVRFFDHLTRTYDLSLDVAVASYTTPYQSDILNAYHRYLRRALFLETPIGLQPLASAALCDLDVSPYTFVLYLRIDIMLKDAFFALFNPFWQEVRYPSVCFKKDNLHLCEGLPRVGDMIVFVPQKYMSFLSGSLVSHEGWLILSEHPVEVATMVDTYHDSDSAKDWNPLYRVVNRPEVTTTYTDPNDRFVWPTEAPSEERYASLQAPEPTASSHTESSS